jgi:hypothetical protein
MAPKSVAILEANPHVRQGAGDPDLRIMVASPIKGDKAPTYFVFFARDKNDNNIENPRAPDSLAKKRLTQLEKRRWSP